MNVLQSQLVLDYMSHCRAQTSSQKKAASAPTAHRSEKFINAIYMAVVVRLLYHVFLHRKATSKAQINTLKLHLNKKKTIIF